MFENLRNGLLVLRAAGAFGGGGSGGGGAEGPGSGSGSGSGSGELRRIALEKIAPFREAGNVELEEIVVNG